MSYTRCEVKLVSYDLLRTFSICGREGTFTAAAASLRITTSAVSQQIRALEDQLGVPLFERRGRRVQLTPEGQRLLGSITPELGRIELALDELVSAHTAVRGQVSLGAPRPFARYWLRPRLPGLLAAHPELELRVEFDVPSALERRLHEGALDLVLLARRSELPGLSAKPIFQEKLLAVTAPGPLPQSREQLQSARWIVFDEDLPMHAHWWRAAFGAHAPLPSRVICQVASLDEMQALAEAGAGLAVLPHYLVAEALAKGTLAEIPSPGRIARNTLWLVWREGIPRTARFEVVYRVMLE
jgi:DNA-binding transcriptional LysR family regulator